MINHGGKQLHILKDVIIVSMKHSMMVAAVKESDPFGIIYELNAELSLFHAGASVGNPRLVALHAASSCVEVGHLCMRNVSIGNL